MHTKRLFLEDLTDQHLTLLLKAVKWSPDVKIEDWLQQLNDHSLGVYELGGRGLIGLKAKGEHVVHVEFLVGKNLRPLTQEIMRWLGEIAYGSRIEALVTRPGLVRYYSRLGFKPLGTWMRL